MWIAFIYTDARLKREAKSDRELRSTNKTDERRSREVTASVHLKVVSMK